MTALEPWIAGDSAAVPADDIEISPLGIDAPAGIEGDGPIRIPDASPTALRGFRRIAAVLVLADAGAILLVLLALGVPQAGTGHMPGFLLVLAIGPFVWVGVFHSFGLYGIRHLPPSEEFRRLISAVTLGILLITVGSVWWERALDRSSLAARWLAVLVLELAVRRIAHWHVGRAKERGALAMRTLIVGVNQEADSIADVLSAPVRGFHPIGFVSTSSTAENGQRTEVIGTLDDLAEVIRRTSAECVFVASSAISSADLYRVSRCCRQANIEMRLSANTREVLTSRVSVHQVRDLVVLAVRSAHLTRSQAAVKRSFDLIISTLGLVVALPLIGAIALAVRLTSPGPVLFRQERVTKDGRRFTVYKFRSMTFDPDARGVVIDVSKPYFKMRDDPRLTPVGRLLRSWSLDEFPQLWNVIRGDMSLVGPRPLAREQVEAGSELMEARHEVRAGLTGWWQIKGRSDVEAEDALKMDLFYIENWSLALDLYVVLKTIGVVLRRKGAY